MIPPKPRPVPGHVRITLEEGFPPRVAIFTGIEYLLLPGVSDVIVRHSADLKLTCAQVIFTVEVPDVQADLPVDFATFFKKDKP